MAQVWKEIVRVGRHTYLDSETGEPRVLDATPETVKYWYEQGKLMRGAGLSIPIPLEHNPEAKPLTAAERAAKRLLNNAGFVEDFDLRKVKDKDKDGKEIEVEAVFGLHDIPDPAVVKKLPGSIKWVSPWISSFVDGTGKAWSGVISHSALTTRPRITRQEPFPDLSAALSLAASFKGPAFDPAKMPAGKGFPLSRAGLLAPDGKPTYPMAFSLWQGAKLAVEDLKKPEKKAEPKEGAAPKEGAPPAKDGAPKEGAPPPKEGADVPKQPPGEPGLPTEASLVDPDGDIGICDVLCDLLEVVGIILGEGITDENFHERLYQSVLEKMKAGKAPDPTMSAANNGQTPLSPDAKVAAPPIYMSQPVVALSMEQINAIPDPTLKSIALSLHQQQQTNEALRKHAFADAEGKRQARLAAILPKLKPDAQAKLTERVNGAQFSLGDDGTVKDSLAEVLDILDGHVLNGIDLPALLTNPSAALAVMPHPKEMAPGGWSEQRHKEVMNQQAEAMGRKPVYAENGTK